MRNFVIGCIVLFTTAGTAFSETKEPPKKLAVDLGGGVKMELVFIPSGEFKMGSGESAEATAAFFNKSYGKDLLDAYVRGLEREVMCFVGASGITAAEGFTTRTAVEATNKQTILDLGARRFIVADAAKIGNAWSTRFADVGPGVTLVTNDESASDPSFLQATEAIKDAGCEIVLC